MIVDPPTAPKAIEIGHRLARRTGRMHASAIREILKVASRPGMISLAGGLPAPESFPVDIVRQLCDEVLSEDGERVLQYHATEGYGPLREALVPFLAERGVHTSVDDVSIFHGSQNVLDTLAKVLISPGDVIAVESPSYLGALSAFDAYEPNYVMIATDDEGVLPDDLDRVLREHPVKLVYLVPTFQNPTGRTLSPERRVRVAEILREHDALLLEDDPYGMLRYEGTAPLPLHALAPERVVYTSTFSKILAPGLRLGFVVAPRALSRWMVIAKQGVDLHTNTLGQAIAAAYLSGGYLTAHLPKILELYHPRRDAMLQALENHMPDGFVWTRPEGGMFLWVIGPERVDGEALNARCIEHGVAFVPGRFFHADDSGSHTFRLNFTAANRTTMDGAVRLMADAARAMLSASA